MKLTCEHARPQLAALLDNALGRSARRAIHAHVEHCGECEAELSSLRHMRVALRALGSVQVPDDLGLRLRIAISHEAARTRHAWRERLGLMWKNSGRALTLRWSAGMAGSFALITAMALLIGMFAAPATVQASDQPVGLATPAHFRYSAFDAVSLPTAKDEAIVVQVEVGADGRAYDYHVLAGDLDSHTRAMLENLLYFAVFQPATVFGEPVSGQVVMSFAGVAVRG